ncbi:MAG TPA: hypothetical protein VGZ69_06560 [Candidatus Rhabdochlamydia sp.]|jgi:hypothetical protein|nr:hypothetical protein [Candidatus Rhabdochlamydia sp.]
MTSTRSMRSVESSFYTASSSPSSTDELSSVINLNGKSYYLTVHHKKSGSDWEEITQSYLEQAKGINLQEALQKHINFKYKNVKNIEITTSIDLKTGFVCTVKDTDGTMRKVPEFSLTASQNDKIFAVLKKIETPRCILDSSSLSEESLKTLDSSSIKISLKEKVDSYLEQIPAINHKPVGFQNKSMNCGFNSCLQMIVNEPALRNIYATVASYYAKSTKKEDRECGNQMLSILDSYDQAIEKQELISEEVSNNLRLAMHYLSPKEISRKENVQEDASEILTILFAENDHIIKEQNLINTSSINYKFENVIHYQSIKALKETPHKDCSSLHADNTYRKERTNYGIKINFDAKQEDFTLSSLLEKHFCDKEIGIGSETRRYLVNGIYTEVSPVKEEIKLNTLPKDLFINFARFKADRTKLTHPIEVPEQLDAKLLNSKNSPSGLYELSSFIVHLGSSSNGGHYIAYRKVQGQWVECNDGSVSYISKKEMLSAAKNSYICFYRLKDE